MLRQKACRDGGWVADVTRHGLACTWRDARAGTAATHGQEHGGCLLSSRAGLLMNGHLPAANEGARWRFVRALCQEAKYRSAAADALLGKSLLRRPPIHLIPLSARSFVMGGVDLSKRARFCVEGRWPCRG